METGTRHQLPDALPWFPRFEEPGGDVDDSFPDEAPSKGAYQGLSGPAMDGTPLSELQVEEVDMQAIESIAAAVGINYTPGNPQPRVAQEKIDEDRTAAWHSLTTHE